MKRIIYIIMPLILFACLPVFFTSVSAEAVSNTSETDTEEEYYSEFESILPDLVKDSIGEVDSERAGELIGIKSVLNDIITQFGKSSGTMAKFFFTLLGLTVLSAAGGIVKGNIASAELSKAIDTGISAVFALSVFSVVFSKAKGVAALLGELRDFNTALTPIVFALNAAGGNSSGAACGAVSMSVAGFVTGRLCADVLLPLAGAVFVFALASSVSGETNVGAVGKLVKSSYMWLLGIISFLISAAFSFQSVLSVSADTFAMRSIKYAAGMLPLVGGTVSGSLSALSAGLSLIRSTIGVSAVAAIWLLFLPALIELIAARFSFSICATISSMLSDSTAERMLVSFRGVIDMLLGSMVICQIMTIINISVFMKSAVAI